MRTVTIHEAKTRLSRLIEEVLYGESIVMARGKNPVPKLVPLRSARPPRKAGGAAGSVVRIADDFDADLDAILDDRNDLSLSPASYWGILPKVFDREMRANGIGRLEITETHYRGIVDLPFMRRDPFDRLIVAQARHDRCTIVTSDPRIAEYDVKCLW
jgi:PIN domain nuclease of toxin-antitoxin system